MWLTQWRTCLQCGRPGFDPWVGKIPWRKERLSTPVFWPGELQGLYSPWGHKELDTTELLSSQGYGFFCGHVWMWELDCEESWPPKNWCFWTVVLEKTLETLLDCKEIQPVHPKGDPSWVLVGRTDVEAETPILWPPHAKSWLIGKDSDTGKD